MKWVKDVFGLEDVIETTKEIEDSIIKKSGDLDKEQLRFKQGFGRTIEPQSCNFWEYFYKF